MIDRLAIPLLTVACAMAQQAPQITMEGATYQVRIQGQAAPVVTARLGAQIDGQWIYSTDYPQHRRDGQTITHTDVAEKPDLVCTLLPQAAFVELHASVVNHGSKPVNVQAIRILDATGD